MSQAVLRWQEDEGLIAEDYKFTETSGTYLMNWYNEAIGKYIRAIKKEQDNSYLYVAFNDGSGFVAYIPSAYRIWFFYCTEYKYCAPEAFDGKRTFVFQLSNGKFGPYGMENNDREEVLNACKYGNTDVPDVSSKGRRHYCARLIQMDGWEIKDDYPWGQVMLEK